MKVITILTISILLSGCGQYVEGNNIDKFIRSCEPYGGIDYILAQNSADNLRDIAYCKEGGVSISGDG